MEQICQKLVFFFFFPLAIFCIQFKPRNYLSLYRLILQLAQDKNDDELQQYISEKNSDLLRDIHAAVKGSGRRGYNGEMRTGIIEKFKELRQNVNKMNEKNEPLKRKKNLNK